MQYLVQYLVKEYLGCFFNIITVFESQKIGEKASFFETKKAQIVIFQEKKFSQKICKKSVLQQNGFSSRNC